jgi:hypothetical protein
MADLLYDKDYENSLGRDQPPQRVSPKKGKTRPHLESKHILMTTEAKYMVKKELVLMNVIAIIVIHMTVKVNITFHLYVHIII